jgi:hypothetical protein
LENLKEKDHFYNFTFAGMVILKWILKEIGHGSMDWIHLAVDRVQWWAV